MLQSHFEHNQPYMIEYRFKTKSGNYQWFLGNGKVFRDEMGRPKRMVGSLIDIHDRKTRELNLVDNEKHFRELVERAVDIFFITDANGLFVYMNDAAVLITGFHKAELEGAPFTVLVHPDYKKKVLRFYLNQFINKIPLTYYEFPIVTKEGQLRWIGQNVQIIFNEGVLMGVQAIARHLPNYI
jgi:PAS domain S-box-containing protein